MMHYCCRCEVLFTSGALEQLSGTVRFNVEPQFENNSLVCSAVKMPYDYQLSEYCRIIIFVE